MLDTVVPLPPSDELDGDDWQPEPMRCADCRTEWYSRMALLLASTDLGRCASCGGRLELATAPQAAAA